MKNRLERACGTVIGVGACILYLVVLFSVSLLLINICIWVVKQILTYWFIVLTVSVIAVVFFMFGVFDTK